MLTTTTTTTTTPLMIDVPPRKSKSIVSLYCFWLLAFPFSLFSLIVCFSSYYYIVLLPSTYRRPSTPPPSFFDFVILSALAHPIFCFFNPAIPRLGLIFKRVGEASKYAIVRFRRVFHATTRRFEDLYPVLGTCLSCFTKV